MNLSLLFPCWELYSVLSFAGLLSAFVRIPRGLAIPWVIRPFHRPNQTRKQTADLNIFKNCSAAWDPLLQWCHPGSCRVFECNEEPKQELEQQEAPSSWCGPWDPTARHPSGQHTALYDYLMILWFYNSPPQRHCLYVSDTWGWWFIFHPRAFPFDNFKDAESDQCRAPHSILQHSWFQHPKRCFSFFHKYFSFW